MDLCTFLIKKVEPLQLEEACVGEGLSKFPTSSKSLTNFRRKVRIDDY